MRRRIMTTWCLTAAMAQLAFAQPAPIPPDRQITARVERHLAAPTEQPMHMPTDVAVDAAGRVYVADGVNNRILRFNPQGGLDAVITQAGSERLNRPVGIAVGPEDRLWIADTGHHRVLVVGSTGELLERIELPAENGGHAADPTDLTITPDGKRTYIIDNDNHHLLIRDNETGTFAPAMGGMGEGLGKFRYPFMVCIAADGYVYVSEVIGSRLQRISSEDRWAGQVGRWGVELGALYRPKGVAADGANRLFVSDSTLGVVQVFGGRGNVLGVVTDETGSPLRFEHPMGMCFDADGRLYVVELRANRVAVVALAEPAAPAPGAAPSGKEAR